ncbi:hypothetical protein F5Y00DRAFT_107021 [Daldinia vernicosa]|uniref:uncharacterized protein n=1 Tax=Daldinia vernicosa TaxID=114800 RepID=UPI002007DE3B|nr:uncharacterized protein F5Y00DRAFT_107021 [Daldinia vernicosa]KAI0847897.1 hypothetical protein F5Y00DRAFT_107021 [Daldinia vernicosa]
MVGVFFFTFHLSPFSFSFPVHMPAHTHADGRMMVLYTYIHIYVYIREEDRTVWRTASPLSRGSIYLRREGNFWIQSGVYSRTASGYIFIWGFVGRASERVDRVDGRTGLGRTTYLYIPYVGRYVFIYPHKYVGWGSARCEVLRLAGWKCNA